MKSNAKQTGESVPCGFNWKEKSVVILQLCLFSWSRGHASVKQASRKKPSKNYISHEHARWQKRGRSSGGSWRLESVSGEAAETETESSNETPRFLTGLFLGFFVSYHGLTEQRKVSGLCLSLTESCLRLLLSHRLHPQEVKVQFCTQLMLSVSLRRASSTSPGFHSAGVLGKCLFFIYLCLNVSCWSVLHVLIFVFCFGHSHNVLEAFVYL